MKHALTSRMSALTMIALLASWGPIDRVSAAGPSTQPGDGPRYRLTVGQELTYTTTSKMEPAMRGRSGGTTTVSFRVVGTTADGAGWHVVARQTAEGSPQAQVSAFDLWPDGHQSAEPTMGMPASPVGEFPPLPPTPAATAWYVPTPDGKLAYHAAPATRPATLEFTANTDSAMDTIYVATQTESDTFDVNRGMVVHATGRSSQDYGFHMKQTWTRELTADALRPADETARYGAQATAALNAQRDYQATMMAAGKTADPTTAATAAIGKLEAVQPTVTDPDLSAMLAESVKEHGEFVKELADERATRDAVVGHPAPPFDLVDLDGKRHALADLKGQVVVLDFWYRGCGWCMRAMPQVRQLSEEYKGRPVAVFGMNADRKQDDAKFVADFFALPYPTLLMEAGTPTSRPTTQPAGVPEAYHVQGFPTTVVVGPDGIVRALEVGYSPVLHDTLKHAIDGLLTDGPHAAAQ